MFRPVPIEEVSRKVLHILVVVFPVLIFYSPIKFGISKDIVFKVVTFLLIYAFATEYLRLNNNQFRKWFNKYLGFMLRESESHSLTGGFYVVAALFICSGLNLISDQMSASCFLGFTLFIIGDGAAALVGKSMGRTKIGDKTLEGALGCFLICFFIAFLLFPYLPEFEDLWGRELTMFNAASLSLSVAVLELFPLKIKNFILNDNLYVPGVVSVLAVVLP